MWSSGLFVISIVVSALVIRVHEVMIFFSCWYWTICITGLCMFLLAFRYRLREGAVAVSRASTRGSGDCLLPSPRVGLVTCGARLFSADTAVWPRDTSSFSTAFDFKALRHRQKIWNFFSIAVKFDENKGGEITRCIVKIKGNLLLDST